MKRALALCLFFLAACGDGDADGGEDGGETSASSAEVEGSVDDVSVDAESAVATFVDYMGGTEPEGFIQFSIQEWVASCARQDMVMQKSQLNFTVRASGGTIADLTTRTYDVEDVVEGDITYSIAGGMGRYFEECSTGDGFTGITRGSLTLETITATEVTGSFDFDLEGEHLTGDFIAERCSFTPGGPFPPGDCI